MLVEEEEKGRRMKDGWMKWRKQRGSRDLERISLTFHPPGVFLKVAEAHTFAHIHARQTFSC